MQYNMKLDADELSQRMQHQIAMIPTPTLEARKKANAQNARIDADVTNSRQK